jgi:phosphatidylinositol glycan class B
LYGTHPIHWYITAGIPAIAGLLLPFLVLDLFGSWSYARRNLWIICIVYVVTHSYSEHKEFRFLLPLLPLFCLLSGQRLKELIVNKPRGNLLLTMCAWLNLVAVMYLGLVHQRAPLDVNHEIVHLVKHEPQTYTIHYLMGCHSTPLLSHLHIPPIKFETWTLDCSPECRSNPDVECESETFSKDPGRFMEEAYFHCSDFEEGTCVTDLRIFYPDFLVANAGDVPDMRSRISNMGMEEVARFTNGINGIRLAGSLTLGADSFASNAFTKVTMFSDLVVLSLDEMVLFKSEEVKPRY